MRVGKVKQLTDAYSFAARQAGLEVALESDAARTPPRERHSAVAARAEGETGRTAADAKRRGAMIL